MTLRFCPGYRGSQTKRVKHKPGMGVLYKKRCHNSQNKAQCQMPGGKWYRDLGDGNGHFWAHVQAIKRPTLLEFPGPLFASFPFVSNVQYRLSEVDDGTLIAFRHAALGFVSDEHKAGMNKGWAAMHERVRRQAEAG
jgi:hypothetical protein